MRTTVNIPAPLHKLATSQGIAMTDVVTLALEKYFGVDKDGREFFTVHHDKVTREVRFSVEEQKKIVHLVLRHNRIPAVQYMRSLQPLRLVEAIQILNVLTKKYKGSQIMSDPT